MVRVSELLTNRRMRIALLICGVLAVVGSLIAWRMGFSFASIQQGWKEVERFLSQYPWLMFVALVILPGLPVPTSALLLTAGVIWSDRPWMACGVGLLALSLNFCWTYWLAAKPARGLVEKLIAASAIKIPDLPREDHVKLILVLRLTPGIPLFFQNYLLGFLRAPFLLYLPISILCSGVVGCGIILSGAGLADGRLLPALTGVSMIVLGLILIQLLRRWLAKRKLVVEGEVRD